MDKIPESASNSKKRPRNEKIDADNNDTDQTLSLENGLTFCHTLVALRILRAQFPNIEKSLRREKVLHIFNLNTGQNDHAIMFLDDYINQHSLLSLGGKLKDGDISLFIDAGILIRQLIDPEVYWFAIPNIGSLLKGLSQGRKEILSLLNHNHYKEMMLAPMERKRLRLSPLDTRFNLCDLIGMGHLRTVQTPTGLAVQVSKD